MPVGTPTILHFDNYYNPCFLFHMNCVWFITPNFLQVYFGISAISKMKKFGQVFQTFPPGPSGERFVARRKIGPNLHLKPITMPSYTEIHKHRNTEIHKYKYTNKR